MSVIRWEDPPPVGRGRGAPPGTIYRDWPAIGADLRSRPGTWALVAITPSAITAGTYAVMIAGRGQRSLVTLGPGRFEAVSRKVNGEGRVYARYVGESGERAR